MRGAAASPSPPSLSPPAHDVPFAKRVRRHLASLRQYGHSMPLLCAVVALVTLVVVFAFRLGAGEVDDLGSYPGSAVVDPCTTASLPKVPPRFFDLDAGTGGHARFHSFGQRRETSVKAPVFHTLNEDGFFRHEVDFAQNTTNTDLDLSYDSVMNQRIALRVLREFYDAPTLLLKGVWTQFVHIDRWRIQFVLRTRLVKDKTTHPDIPTAPKVPQSNRVLIQRTFAGSCEVGVIGEELDDNRPPIYVVAPYSGWKPLRLARFILQIEMMQAHPLLKGKQQVNLIVALHDMTEAQFRKQFEMEDIFAHSSVYIVEPPVTPGDTMVPFSRGTTLRVGVEKGFIPEDALVFLSDIDMHIYPSFFGSCRSNAVRGSQIYFPVPYNLYPNEEKIQPGAGFWDFNSTGMACMYRSDFDEVHPWRKSYTDSMMKYTGKGREDDDLLDSVLAKSDKYRAFRAVDPWLRHAWHMKVCKWNMRRLFDCMWDAYKALGGSASLGRWYVKWEDRDLQYAFREFDEDWDPKEKAISLRRSKDYYLEEPDNPEPGRG
jgi:Chondroitin N-acetylgalactosaminyltransferase